jgi:diguanylate cyclase (GGDEF)-like protein
MENCAEFWQRVQKQSAAIMIIDADHFKKINDQYGHPAGDAALVEMARRIQTNVRENDVVVRWGGEEFLVCSFSCNETQAQMMARRILEEFQSTPLLFEDKQISISASVGYILLPLQSGSDEHVNFEESIKLADAALYLAKAKGRNRAIGIEKINAKTKSYSELFDHFEEAVAAGDIEIKESLGA